ncbi:Hypothetical predicted protein [Octopus vulgaris]|uniref:Uncharacterized protein n=1 Tax=Octopus vulgaris TaxID=6645 RepID=A0AA36FK22_OCTVU|nr:Hypothetical predicted protein [Octopus vulgaris]
MSKKKELEGLDEKNVKNGERIRKEEKKEQGTKEKRRGKEGGEEEEKEEEDDDDDDDDEEASFFTNMNFRKLSLITFDFRHLLLSKRVC